MEVDYDPTPLPDCQPDNVDQKEDLKTAYTDWKTDLNPKDAADDTTFDTAIGKCMNIAAYVEASDFTAPGGSVDYTFGTDPSTLIKVSAITKATALSDVNEVYDMYTCNIQDNSNADLMTIMIVNNFNLELWVLKGADFAGNYRGYAFIHGNITGVPVSAPSFIIGAGKDAIPAMYLLEHYNDAVNLTGCIINMPAIFTSATYTATAFKRARLYDVDAWEYRYPNRVLTDPTSLAVTDLYPLDHSDATHFMWTKVSDPNPGDCITAVGGSIYNTTHTIHHGGILDACYVSLGIPKPTVAFDLPTTTGQTDRNNARKAFYVLRYNYETSLINSFDKKFDFDLSDGLGAIRTTDNKLFIVLIDKFNEEPLLGTITEDDVTTAVAYSNASYSIINSTDKNYTTPIGALSTATGAVWATDTIFIYSFGANIHSFLRDLFTAQPTINPTNITIYCEGYPSITKGFTGFGDIVTIAIHNIWQDSIINEKTDYVGTEILDDIQIDVLYDLDTSAVSAGCMHTIYGYDKLLNPTP